MPPAVPTMMVPGRLVPIALMLLPMACAELPEEAGEPSTGTVRFESATESAGLAAFTHVTGAYGDRLFPETMGSGVAFLDYDDDGWPDILAVGGSTWPGHGAPVRAVWLFRNDGDGTFTDVTDAAGLGEVHAYGFGVAVADYDLDGDRDFYLSTVFRNLLFRNDEIPDTGERRFVEVGAVAGVDGGDDWSTSAAFFHADGDPYPDLYVANYVPWTAEIDKFCSVDGMTKSYCTPLAYEGVPGRFYHNNGDGTFADWTDRAGFVNSPGKSLGVLPLDFDRDGWTDLMVTNDAVRDLLYRNRGNGTFSEAGLFTGIAFDERGRARAGMGVDAGVMDSTGFITVFVGNFSNETLGVYRYSAAGTFEERASSAQLAVPSIPTLTFGLAVVDVDLDGDLDLFTANGHVQDDIEQGGTNVTYRQAAHLFINDGSGRFRDVVPDVGGALAAPVVARSVAVADFDRDGDADLLVSVNGGPLQLWRNESMRGHFVQIEAASRQGSDALGATIELFTPSRTQFRFVRTGHSYLAASEPVATFGLGSDSAIDSVRVTWPGGRAETWRSLEPDRRYRLTEGASRPEHVALKP